jgi:eukaryotic-like serine/threonine-protein kinase
MRGSQETLPRFVGRYAVYDEISSGGMGSVNYGRLLGPVGFSRTVAIKRLHEQFVKDREFVAMFIDEARLATRIRHPNVVQTTDIVVLEDEIFLVMDFVQGESLSKLWRSAGNKAGRVPLDVTATIMVGVLHGLHAAHIATNERGESLHIVHRDVSPQNILVGADGVPRVIDFGIAKASGRAQSTRDGQVKGKLAYMAPEQLRAETVDRRADIFAAGIVLWELLSGKRLFAAESEGAVVTKVLGLHVEPPSTFFSDVPGEVDAIVLKALARDPASRFETAEAMALALEAALPLASTTRVARFVAELAAATLAKRAKAVAAIEESSDNQVRALDSVPNLDPSDLVEAETTTRSDAAEDAPATQPSSISVSRPSLPAAPPAGARLPTAVIAVAGVAATTLVFLAFMGIRSLAGSPAPAVAEVAPLATVVAAPAVTAATIAPSTTDSTTASAIASAERPAAAPVEPASSAAPPATRHAAPATGAGGARPRVGVAASPAPATSRPCVLRTYFDQAGIKHFEKQCP